MLSKGACSGARDTKTLSLAPILTNRRTDSLNAFAALSWAQLLWKPISREMGLQAPRTKPTKPSRVTARPFRAGVTTELWLNQSDQLIVNEGDNMVVSDLPGTWICNGWRWGWKTRCTWPFFLGPLRTCNSHPVWEHWWPGLRDGKTRRDAQDFNNKVCL